MSNGNPNFTSLIDGTLSPDSRVNYDFGLVLGVNEFRQEQKYFLEKHYLHNSELHGYGTVTGLQVIADPYPSEDKPTDVQVTVKPGMAIDQLGRPLIVRTDQCARLGAWLAQQEKDTPGTLAKRPTDEDGFMSVYVVVSYAEAQENAVPVAGASSNNGNSMYSRIRDSFDIEFSWDQPQMPAWDSVREFSALLSKIHVAPNKPHSGTSDTDTDNDDTSADDADDDIEHIIEEICEGVRKIGQLFTSDDDDASNGSSDDADDTDEKDIAVHRRKRGWYLPSDTIQDAMDRIFAVWVTEVRPQLLPNLIDSSAAIADQQAGILLASIDFVPDTPFLVNKPKILDFEEPANEGRPFLLQTQLLQELLSEGIRTPREFASLQVLNNRTLQAWIHHPVPLLLPLNTQDWSEVLQLKSDGQSLTLANVTLVNLPDRSTVLEISIDADDNDTSTMMLPGARVELTFKVEGFTVARDDHDDHHDDEKPEKAESGVFPGVEDVVKGTVEGAEDVLKGKPIKGVERAVEGAFHGVEDIVEGAFKGVEDVVKGAAHGVEDVEEGAVEGVKDALKGKVIKGAEDVVEGVVHGAEDVVEGGVKGVEDVVGVSDEDDRHKEHEHSLSDSIDDLGIDYVGYDRIANTITVYTIASHWPTRELVTLYLYNPQMTTVRAEHPASTLATAVGSETALHIWFHTDAPVKLPENCQVLVPLSFNQPPQPMTFAAIPPPGNMHSYFWALVPPAGLPLQPGELLTVVFDTDQILVEREDSSNNSGNGDSDKNADVTNTGAAGESADVTNIGSSGEGADVTNTGAAGESADVTNIGSGGTDVTNINNDSKGSDEDNSQTLTDVIKSQPYTYVGYDGNHIIEAHHQVPLAMQTIIEPGQRQLQPTLPFVTITHMAREREERESATEELFELWFHLIPDPSDDIASFNEGITCEVSAELSDLRRSGKAEISNITALQLNVYMVSVSLAQPPANQQAYYVCFKFSLLANPVSVRRGTFFQSLGEYVQSRGINFEGFNGRDAIIAYARIPVRRTT